MKLGRAIAVGILIWVLIFIEWSIMLFIPVLKDALYLQWLIHYIVLFFLAILAAHLYYKSKDKVNGFALGLVLLIIGIILDIIVTVPFFIEEGYVFYFSNIYLWIGFIELIIVVWFYKLIKK